MSERPKSIPPVLRSEQHLAEAGVPLLRAGALAPVALPISPEGVTFDMAQAAGFVDFDHFAVGRWDGSLTVFRFSLEGCEPCVVTGSEDGDLCVVSVPDARIRSRTRYNPKAQRGINAVALQGSELLVANCSVGPEDSNLWLYSIDPADWTITVRDSAGLKVNPDAAQVFNFAVIWAEYTEGRCFFASTQEGALWMGTADGGRLSVLGYQQVTAPLGAALAWANNGNLAFIAYDWYEFNTRPRSSSGHVNPHRLSS
jgi:hypothetical protein